MLERTHYINNVHYHNWYGRVSEFHIVTVPYHTLPQRFFYYQRDLTLEIVVTYLSINRESYRANF